MTLPESGHCRHMFAMKNIDTNTSDDEHRHAVSLFRYTVITEALHLSHGELCWLPQ